MFANNSKCVPQVTMYLPHQNVSTWAQTSCQSKPNTSLSKSNSVTRWSFWFAGFFPMWHATPEPTAQSYLQILFDLVVSMFVVLRWYWFLTRPFLSSSCHTFFFFFSFEDFTSILLLGSQSWFFGPIGPNLLWTHLIFTQLVSAVTEFKSLVYF